MMVILLCASKNQGNEEQVILCLMVTKGEFKINLDMPMVFSCDYLSIHTTPLNSDYKVGCRRALTCLTTVVLSWFHYFSPTDLNSL